MDRDLLHTVGTKVTYARSFLRSAGIIDYATANRRGTIVAIRSDLGGDRVQVTWDDEPARSLPLSARNLWPVVILHKEAM